MFNSFLALLQKDPTHRPTAKDILLSDWFKIHNLNVSETKVSKQISAEQITLFDTDHSVTKIDSKKEKESPHIPINNNSDKKKSLDIYSNAKADDNEEIVSKHKIKNVNEKLKLIK